MSNNDSHSLEQVVKDHKGKMKYTRLGSSGLRVSRICLGFMSYGSKAAIPWALEDDKALPLIKAAYDCGINFWDTANIYSWGHSEELLGRALKHYKFNRDDLVIATKLFGLIPRQKEDGTYDNARELPLEEQENNGYTNQQGLNRKHIFASVDASLKRLDIDYIDLLIIHRFDPETPVKETMKALHDVVMSGKVRYIGASSMHAWQFVMMQMTARQNGWTEFISMQDYYCASYRHEEIEMLPACKEFGVGVTPWSPLGGGLLARPWSQQTGITSRGENSKEPSDEEKKINEAIEKIAKAKGVSMAQVANAWVFRHAAVDSSILGISNARSLHDGLASVHLQLTDEEAKEIESPYKPRAIVGHN